MKTASSDMRNFIEKKRDYYKHGLDIGDLVCYEKTNVISLNHANKESGIVLERKLMRSKQTQCGEKKYFEYKILSINNKVRKIKTQNMKLIYYRSTNENSNYR